MRVTVVQTDRTIGVNNIHYVFEEWNFEDSHIHAIQWYDDHGEIELKTLEDNIKFEDFSIVEPYVSVWEQRHEIEEEKRLIAEKTAEYFLKLEKVREEENLVELQRLESRLKQIEQQIEQQIQE